MIEYAARAGPVFVRVTRTPLAGGAASIFEEWFGNHAALMLTLGTNTAQTNGRVLALQRRGGQSLGDREVVLTIWNDDGFVDSWAGGDSIKVEARAFDGGTTATILDGFLAGVDDVPENGRSAAILTVKSWEAVLLDGINLAVDKSYTNTAWTSIADDLVTTALGGGFARSITTDAATPASVTFKAGTKLRSALDVCRRALNAGASKWEHVVDKVAGVKTYRLYKRDASVQASYKLEQLLPGSRRSGRNVLEVVNKATVTGGSAPTFTVDKTGLTRTGRLRLDATTQSIWQPVEALDSVLSEFSFRGTRGATADPPILEMRLQPPFARSATVDGYVAQTANAKVLSFPGVADDPGFAVFDLQEDGRDSLTIAAPGDSNRETLDLGASPPEIRAIRVVSLQGVDTVLRIQSSTDNVSYTTRYTTPTGNNSRLTNVAIITPTTARYWRLQGNNAAGGNQNLQVFSVALIRYDNRATDPSGPEQVHSTSTTALSSFVRGIGQSGVFAKFDFLVPTDFQQFSFVHHETVQEVNMIWRLQHSDDDVTWNDLAIIDSSSTLVTDTVYRHIRTRYIRWFVENTGTQSTTFRGRRFHVYPYASDPGLLLSGALTGIKGGNPTWGINDLVSPPGLVVAKSFAQPNLGLLSGNFYNYQFIVNSAGSAKSFWELDYRTDFDVTSLLGYWGFFEGGVNAIDASANNNTMVAQNVGSDPIYGVISAVMPLGIGFAAFVSGFAQATSITAYNAGSTFTVAAWVRVDEQNKKTAIADIEESWFLWVDNGTLKGGRRSGGVWVTASAVILDDIAGNPLSAFHCAMRYDGATLKLIVNGTERASVAATGAINFNGTKPLRALKITDDGGTTRESSGAINDLYYFGRALSVAEVNTLYGLELKDKLFYVRSSQTNPHALPADATLLYNAKFNEREFFATAEDAGSQATYANFVPGGVLFAGLRDEALIGKDSVQAEADALVNRRKTPPQRVRVIVPFDPTIVEGKRITLTEGAAFALRLGSSDVTLDVVAVDHEFTPRARTVLHCDEYALDAALGGSGTLDLASRATV